MFRNLFHPLEDHHYKAVLHELCFSQILNLLEPLVDQHYNVVSHEFDVF